MSVIRAIFTMRVNSRPISGRSSAVIRRNQELQSTLPV